MVSKLTGRLHPGIKQDDHVPKFSKVNFSLVPLEINSLSEKAIHLAKPQYKYDVTSQVFRIFLYFSGLSFYNINILNRRELIIIGKYRFNFLQHLKIMEECFVCS